MSAEEGFDEEDGGGGGRWEGKYDGGDDGDGGGLVIDDDRGYSGGDGADEEDDMYDMIEGLGDEMPDFASQKNKDLHRAIQVKESRVDGLRTECGENSERVDIMEEHLRNVSSEFLHTQQLLDAKQREIQSEDHLRQLASREAGRVRAEVSKLRTDYEDIQDKLNVVQNAIFKGNEKMDRFKLQMNWNQEELEQWALAARQKEEDNLALQKYTRADEVKIKELTLQIEKLTKSVATKKVSTSGYFNWPRRVLPSGEALTEIHIHFSGLRRARYGEHARAYDRTKT